jgi:transcription-repair coupling factor (superfamily II helicase)
VLRSADEYMSHFDKARNPDLEEHISFEPAASIHDHLKKFYLVEWGTGFIHRDSQKAAFKTSPQPSFNKNFNMLIEDLAMHTGKGYKNIILADNAKQQERILSIIEDVRKKKSQSDGALSFEVVLCTLHEGFIDHDQKIAFYTDHQIFDRYHRYRGKKIYSRNQAITLKELYALKPGDFVTHIDHGIGKFAGLETIEVNGKPSGSSPAGV